VKPAIIDTFPLEQHLHGLVHVRPFSRDEAEVFQQFSLTTKLPQYEFGRLTDVGDLADGLHRTADGSSVFLSAAGLADIFTYRETAKQWYAVRLDDAGRCVVTDQHQGRLKTYGNYHDAMGFLRAYTMHYLLDLTPRGLPGARKKRAYRIRIGERDPEYMLPFVQRNTAAVSAAKKSIRRCQFPGCDADHGLEAHHLAPLYLGGYDHQENLVVLCHRHHRMMHGADAHVRMESLAKTLGKDLNVLFDPRYITNPAFRPRAQRQGTRS
jgi:hypothetical protein